MPTMAMGATLPAPSLDMTQVKGQGRSQAMRYEEREIYTIARNRRKVID
jgi:hypothetical protein